MGWHIFVGFLVYFPTHDLSLVQSLILYYLPGIYNLQSYQQIEQWEVFYYSPLTSSPLFFWLPEVSYLSKIVTREENLLLL